MATFTLTTEQYESLIALARFWVGPPDGSTLQQQRAMVLDATLKDIEKSNSIVRYSLWIRWQNPTAPLPPGTDFPKSWPPELSYLLEFISRPIAKADVLAVVAQRTPNAVNVMVTSDPAALLGWTLINDYFVQA